MANPIYEPLQVRSIIKHKDNNLRYLFFFISFVVFTIMIFNILIFLEFYELIMALRILKHSAVFSELGNIKTGEINNVLDVLRSVNFAQIKQILLSISYDDFIEVWEGIKICIVKECYNKRY